MAKLSAPAATRIRNLAATVLKANVPAAKPLKVAMGKPARQPNARGTAAAMKSGYGK
jgi:hypothetical protein